MSRTYLLLTALLIPLPFHSCTPSEQPISNAEALAYAKKIERSIINRNPYLLDNILDEQQFTKRVAAEAGGHLKKKTIDEAVRSIQHARFGQKILDLLGKTGTYLLIRQYQKDNHQHLLFRAYGQESDLNYDDFELVKVDDQLKAADVYVYQSGENLSKTLAEGLIAVQADKPDLTAADRQRTQLLHHLKELVEQKEFEKAKTSYDSLPADFKRQKIFQLYHIQFCSALGDSLYTQSLFEYKALYPDDPNICLMMIDARFMRKQYPMALAAVNKLDSIISGDPFLDYYRSLIYDQIKDTVRSRACLEKLHTNMPTLRRGIFALLVSYINTNEMDKAVRLTQQSRADSTFTTGDLDVLYQNYPALKKKMQTDK